MAMTALLIFGLAFMQTPLLYRVESKGLMEVCHNHCKIARDLIQADVSSTGLVFFSVQGMGPKNWDSYWIKNFHGPIYFRLTYLKIKS